MDRHCHTGRTACLNHEPPAPRGRRPKPSLGPHPAAVAITSSTPRLFHCGTRPRAVPSSWAAVLPLSLGAACAVAGLVSPPETNRRPLPLDQRRILGIANGSRLPGHQKSGTLPLGPDDLEAKPIELSERQLDDVAGGTKEIDKASAKLLQCGKRPGGRSLVGELLTDEAAFRHWAQAWAAEAITTKGRGLRSAPFPSRSR